jgi:hypothetical protein
MFYRCHPRESGDPEVLISWIPAFAGMTPKNNYDTASKVGMTHY